MTTPADSTNPNPIQPSNIEPNPTPGTPQPEDKALGKFNGRTVAEITDTTAGLSMVDKIVKFVKDEKASLSIGGLSGGVTVGAIAVGFSALAIANPAVAIGVGVTAGIIGSIALPILLLVGIEYILRQDSDDIGRGPIPDEIDEDEKKTPTSPKFEVKSETPDEEDDLSLRPLPEPEEGELEIGTPRPPDTGVIGEETSPKKRTELPSEILARELEEERKKEAIIADSLKKPPSFSPASSLSTDSEISPQFYSLEEGRGAERGESFTDKSETTESLYSASIDRYIQESKKNGSMESLLKAAKAMNITIEGLLSLLKDMVEDNDSPVEINQKLRYVLSMEDLLSKLNEIAPDTLKIHKKALTQSLQPGSRIPINKFNDFLNKLDNQYPFPTKLPENELREIKDRLHFLEINKIMTKEHPFVVFINTYYLERK